MKVGEGDGRSAGGSGSEQPGLIAWRAGVPPRHGPFCRRRPRPGDAKHAPAEGQGPGGARCGEEEQADRQGAVEGASGLIRQALDEAAAGGVGAAGGHEGFGKPYDLPNMQAYNETCASIGMDYWNHRLFLLDGDAKYIDIMERTLFNGLLSGVSLDGKTFFYPNPLESNGQHARSEWFGVACCPGNITRFMASVPGYLYATRGNDVYVNLYAGGTADIDTPDGQVKLVQDTRYPWDGAVTLTLDPSSARRFAVYLRIPGWARNEVVPGDLYQFLDNAPPAVEISVNGAPVPTSIDKGYVTIDRRWQAGDRITMNIPMPVRRVGAHPNVAANRDRVALQRGPIVFAAEWPDNPNGQTRNIVLPDAQRLATEFRAELLNGVQVIRGRAFGLARTASGGTTRS